MRVKACVPMSLGRLIDAALTEIVPESAESDTNAELGVKTPLIGQTIAGYEFCTSVLIVTV